MPFKEPPLTLHQLAIFATVVEERSFTHAASLLHLTESAVSQQIALMERIVGMRLLVRTAGKPVRPTEAGKRLLHGCEDVLDRLAVALQEIDALKRAAEGHVTLGATNNFMTYLLPSIYTTFRELNPGISLRVERGLRQELIEGVLSRRLDLAVVGDVIEDARLRSSLLVSTDLILVGPPGHHMASGPASSFDALSLEPLILGRWFGARKAIEGKAAELGLSLQIEWEAGRLEAQINAVAEGMGVALVPFYAAASRLHEGSLSVLRVDGFPVKQDLYVISPVSGTSETTEIFIKHLLAYRSRLPSLCQTTSI